jgi:hypothetical protein
LASLRSVVFRLFLGLLVFVLVFIFIVLIVHRPYEPCEERLHV